MCFLFTKNNVSLYLKMITTIIILFYGPSVRNTTILSAEF